MTTSIEQSPQRYARIGGVLYLAIIVLGLFGEAFVRGTLVVSGDATATASAIAASESLWRAGLAGDLLMHVFDVPVIVVLYLLLRPVSESLALLATFFNLIQTAVLVGQQAQPAGSHPSARQRRWPGRLFPGATARAVLPGHQGAWVWLRRRADLLRVRVPFQGLPDFQVGVLPQGSRRADGARRAVLPAEQLCAAPRACAGVCAVSLRPLPAFVGELCFALWLTFKGVNVEKWPLQCTRART